MITRMIINIWFKEHYIEIFNTSTCTYLDAALDDIAEGRPAYQLFDSANNHYYTVSYINGKKQYMFSSRHDIIKV